MAGRSAFFPLPGRLQAFNISTRQCSTLSIRAVNRSKVWRPNRPLVLPPQFSRILQSAPRAPMQAIKSKFVPQLQLGLHDLRLLLTQFGRALFACIKCLTGDPCRSSVLLSASSTSLDWARKINEIATFHSDIVEDNNHLMYQIWFYLSKQSGNVFAN